MKLGRRAAMLGAAAGLGGCSLFDNIFGDNKTPIEGKREPVLALARGLESSRTTAAP